MNSHTPFISPEGTSTQIWKRDARGPLGEIQLALRQTLSAIVVPDATLLCLALSGGPDSLSLTAASIRVAVHHPQPWPVCALIVDHGWREDSATEAAACARCAQDLGIESVKVLRGDNPSSGQGPEGEARLLRWKLLAQAAVAEAQARGLKRAVILTGHTLDDQAETVLLRLARGASLQAISGMKTVEVLDPDCGLPWRRIEDQDQVEVDLLLARPLLGIRRAQTHAACAQAGLIPVQDPTNRAEGPIRTAQGLALPRAAIRERILPELAAALGKDPAPALARLAQQAGEDEAVLQVLAGQVFSQARFDKPGEWKPGNPVKLDLKTIDKYRKSDPVRYGAPVLRRVVRQAGAVAGMNLEGLTEGHLRGVVDLIVNWHGQGPLNLPGITVTRRDGYLEFASVSRPQTRG